MLIQSIGTAITAVMPLITLVFMAYLISSKSTVHGIIFLVLSLLSFTTTIAVAVWYFNQSFSGEAMGWWYGITCALIVVTCVATLGDV